MSGIYLIQNNDQLIEMKEQVYDSEALLQELLEKYPDLLAGDQINNSQPRKWLLLKREMGVPDGRSNIDRWAIDHLFLDQDGVPTLVEVKRSCDTRIRREVVGQMLDYAANGVVYWSVEKLRTQFEADCQIQGIDPVQYLTDIFEIDCDLEQFWRSVETNLQIGKIRMLFVADTIPTELQRIVEFLNEQMKPAEVLALEIKQFAGQGLKTLVPKVIGRTMKAQEVKYGVIRELKQWDASSFFEELEAKRGTEFVKIARAILEWLSQNRIYVWWGKGKKNGSFIPVIEHNKQSHQLFAVWTDGSIQIYFHALARKTSFEPEAKRIRLLESLNSIEGVSLPEAAINKYPSIALSQLANQAALQQFFDTFTWAVQEIGRA